VRAQLRVMRAEWKVVSVKGMFAGFGGGLLDCQGGDAKGSKGPRLEEAVEI